MGAGAPRLGVCSWSLRPGSPRELAARLRDVGVDCVQLALKPVMHGWPPAATHEALQRAGIEVRSAMLAMRGEDYSTPQSIAATGGVRRDEHWHANLEAAAQAAALCWRLRVPLVSFHAGFLPHDPADPLRAVMLGRLRALIDVFGEHGVHVALETGQESAPTLLAVLRELQRPTAGVNFDPANMLLYGTGDPVGALAALAEHVRQVHIKDARPPRVAGQWGEEVPAGEGDVNWPAFFATLAGAGLRCDLMIEREAGDNRLADIRRAVEMVQRQLDRAGAIDAAGAVGET